MTPASRSRHEGAAGQLGHDLRVAERAAVPNVIGQPEQEAKSNLEQAGFTVSVQTGTPPASGFAPGSVYSVSRTSGGSWPRARR